MNTALDDKAGVLWSTACDTGAVDTAPQELQALGAHVGQCRGRVARLGAAQCALEAVQGFVGARLVTTLTVVVTLVGLVVWLWPAAAGL